MASQLRGYYTQMIRQADESSERVVKAMKKVTATAIVSNEWLVFNDLERHAPFLLFVQNREKLWQNLQDAKNERLQMERIQ